MKLLRGRFRSRRSMRRTLHRRQYGLKNTLDYSRSVPMQGIVSRLKQAFGASKHRRARVSRFQARQRRGNR